MERQDLGLVQDCRLTIKFLDATMFILYVEFIMYVSVHCKNGGKKSVGVLNINKDNLMVCTMLITSGT